jgi:hypothetical protein
LAIDFAESTSLVSEVMPWSADRVEQAVQVVRARVQTLRGEEIGRIVERRVHLFAGGQPVLGEAHQVGGLLQRQEILANAGGEHDIAHDSLSFDFLADGQAAQIDTSRRARKPCRDHGLLTLMNG